jgi:hypothetical protein
MIGPVSLSVLISIAIINILLGLFLFLKPASAFRIQKKFYEKINWRIEPISIDRETRNTKIMGFSLIVLTLLLVVYSCIVSFN